MNKKSSKINELEIATQQETITKVIDAINDLSTKKIEELLKEKLNPNIKVDKHQNTPLHILATALKPPMSQMEYEEKYMIQ